ncbi:extracellular solute-binding protein family 1 [Thecamonas trahens ATCC 50062]|uniref:Extracellular solute-binding protein family 1 n=1 Tax=Thecamonas trahens ATCC 50062 TaxID=461836 RepID=A0A0L0DS47_THETB|nr:extracellular solute-binding protein family 1 [Thecamonas trahens ATCC 50062]KNC55149.1 extracellular solute-binding protein family 1 [Thecamonas trahens ATCC 50062]|eukprot:XP_013753205.1 extracellular solute-binding protein family 1 [Thecamonas trahens ATCC 50062]
MGLGMAIRRATFVFVAVVVVALLVQVASVGAVDDQTGQPDVANPTPSTLAPSSASSSPASVNAMASRSSSTTPVAQSYHPTTLRMHMHSAPNSQFTLVGIAMADYYNAYMNGSSSISVLRFPFTKLLDRSNFASWLTTLGAPDVLPHFQGPRPNDFFDDGLLEDLTDIWDEYGLHDDVLPLGIEASTGSDGKRYQVPMIAAGYMCMYRASIFDTFDISPPVTWIELLAVCAKFKAVGIPCFGTDLDGVPPTQYFDSLAIRMHGNEFYAALFDAQIPFDDPRILAVFDELAPLLDLGYFGLEPSSIPGVSHQVVGIPALARGEVAIVCGIESVSAYVGLFGVPDDDIAVFPFPSFDASHPAATAGPKSDTSAALGVLGIMGVPCNAAFIDTAKDFARLMADKSAMATILANRPGIVPLRSSLASLLTTNRSRQVYETLASAPVVLRSTGIAGFGEPAIFMEWANLVFSFYAGNNAAESRAVLDTTLVVLESLRLRLVLGQAAQPEFSPRSGAFASAVTLTLSSPEEGAVIYFTLDGSEPSFTSSVYLRPIRIATSGTVTVRATAAVQGLSLATPASATYVVNIPPATDSGSVRLSLLLAIVIPVTLACCGICAAVGYVIYRRKSVTYTLVSDAELVIPPENLRVLHVVGRGSYGTVYAGTWRATSVAIKRMHAKVLGPRELSEFVDEAHTLHLLRHPNIVIFMGVTLEPPAIVTEFMDRGSMYEVLHTAELFLDPSMVFKWAHNIAQGLQYLSHAGIVHGDFKSLNVLFDSSWVPKICDFGLSSVKKDGSLADAPLVTKTPRGAAIAAAASDSFSTLAAGSALSIGSVRLGSVPFSSHALSDGSEEQLQLAANVGTVFWAAPEVLVKGKEALTTESDAYALGITLWELATRQDLFPRENVLAVALEVVHGRRPPVEAVPASCAGILPVMKALWNGDAANRMRLDEAVEALGGLYSPEQVIYPSSRSAPSGNIIVLHCVIRHVRDRLLTDIDNAVTQLRVFHDAMPQLAKASSITILQWGLGWVTFGVHRPSQLLNFHFLIADKVGPVTMLAAEGTIVASKDSFGHEALGGPVMATIATRWASMFGTCGSGFDALKPQTSTTTQSSASPLLSDAWQHAVPGGMFVATEGLATQIRELGQTKVAKIPWLVEGEPVFQVVDSTGVAVADAAKPLTARDRSNGPHAVAPSGTTAVGHNGELVISAPDRRSPRSSAALDDLLVGSTEFHDSAIAMSLNLGSLSNTASRTSLPHPDATKITPGPGSLSTSSSSSSSVPSEGENRTNGSPTTIGAPGSSSLASSSSDNSSSSVAVSSASTSSSLSDEEQLEAQESLELSKWHLPRWAIVAMMENCGGAWLGSMAMAYEAVLSGQPVVVKVLLRQKMSPDDLVSFAEAAARATLASTVGVVGPIAVCLDAPLLAVVNPRYDTGSLHDAMTGASPLVLDRRGAHAVATSMTAALTKLHAETERAHGALRPSNIFLVGSNSTIISAHVTDYGFTTVKTTLGTQTMVPTVAYMSPDELRGNLDSMPGDVFVVGTLLYEMLTGQVAFSGRNAIEVSQAMVSDARPSLTDAEIVSPILRRIIDECWASKPASRPTMSELSKQLAALKVDDFVQTGAAARNANETAARIEATRKKKRGVNSLSQMRRGIQSDPRAMSS